MNSSFFSRSLWANGREHPSGARLRTAAGAASAHLRSIVELPPSLRRLDPAGQPFRIAIGVVAVLIPALFLALISPALPLTTPGVVLLVMVAFATYFADWAGGIAALLVASLLLDLFFVGDRHLIGAPKDSTEAAGLALTLVAGAALISLLQRVKGESYADRQAAVAARAAAAALTALETATASHAIGTGVDRESLHTSLLRTMVTVNRAHAGLLFLAGDHTDGLRLAAAYGLDPASLIEFPADVAESLEERMTHERRTWPVPELALEAAFEDSRLPVSGIRSAVSLPLNGTDGRLLGIVVLGMLVEHSFSRIEIARAEALASRSAAILQAATGIDRRESALQGAREEKRWLESVIAAVPEAVVIATPLDGKIGAENQAAVDLLGHQVDRDDAERPALYLPDGTLACPDAHPIVQAIRTNAVVAGVELLVQRVDGTRIPVLVSAAPVHDPAGRVDVIVAVFRDIRALKEASRLKDEFVSVVSHELRSPLTPIRGFVQLVARDLAREGGHESHVGRLNSIAGHVDRMTRLVDDLLDVSRLKSGSLEIRSAPADLAQIAREVVRDRSAAGHDHPFVFETTEPSIAGDWDADRLYQVIDNLVGNAVKYTPAGGKITVVSATDPATGDALVTVSDEGRGISPEDKQRIFGAFYRTREAEAGQVAGLGLGLYICHELVVAHGGSIQVDDSDSGGAAFTIRLPRTTRAIAA